MCNESKVKEEQYYEFAECEESNAKKDVAEEEPNDERAEQECAMKAK